MNRDDARRAFEPRLWELPRWRARNPDYLHTIFIHCRRGNAFSGGWRCRVPVVMLRHKFLLPGNN